MKYFFNYLPCSLVCEDLFLDTWFLVSILEQRIFVTNLHRRNGYSLSDVHNLKTKESTKKALKSKIYNTAKHVMSFLPLHVAREVEADDT